MFSNIHNNEISYQYDVPNRKIKGISHLKTFDYNQSQELISLIKYENTGTTGNTINTGFNYNYDDNFNIESREQFGKTSGIDVKVHDNT